MTIQDDKPTVGADVDAANRRAAEAICAAQPVLVDILPAREVVPGLDERTILTSGAPLPWDEYTGGQRTAVIGGALFEGLADSPEQADARLRSGEIVVAGCQDHGVVGSLAGVTTPSMPVLVVEDAERGTRAFCTLFEGKSPARLNYGVYNDEVRDSLLYLERVVAPLLSDAVRRSGGIPLRPIIRRALHMGDELHSRNTAGTLLFTRELFPQLVALAREGREEVDEVVDYMTSGDYFFLRASMAASKVATDAVRGAEGASVVTAMALSCREFAIRVAGLGDEWFRGPLPSMEGGTLFAGHTEDDIEFMGGESPITESAGLGGFAQAAAFPLQAYQGGTPERMVELNLEMYDITTAEHPEFKIPYLRYRGVPVGIDIRRVVQTGIAPVMDIGIAGRGGGQIGAGAFRAPMQCFTAALEAFERRHPQAAGAAA
ncbi:MAG: hypothetical protein QOF04_3430 [Solirubrobacteraceae bacterium]|jgi:hypothetical protein|nr:hypothetical protein [Solirubrobacteraceae bacterium]